MTFILKLRTVPLIIEAKYQSGEVASHDSEGSADSVELTTVYTAHGDNVSELLSDTDVAELEQMALEEIKAMDRAENAYNQELERSFA